MSPSSNELSAHVCLHSLRWVRRAYFISNNVIFSVTCYTFIHSKRNCHHSVLAGGQSLSFTGGKLSPSSRERLKSPALRFVWHRPRRRKKNATCFVCVLTPHSYEQKAQTAALGFDPQKRIPISDRTNWANLRFSAASIKGNQERLPAAELKDGVPPPRRNSPGDLGT